MTFLDTLVALIPQIPFSLVLKFGVQVPLWRHVGSGLRVPHSVKR